MTRENQRIHSSTIILRTQHITYRTLLFINISHITKDIINISHISEETYTLCLLSYHISEETYIYQCKILLYAVFILRKTTFKPSYCYNCYLPATFGHGWLTSSGHVQVLCFRLKYKLAGHSIQNVILIPFPIWQWI